MAKDPNELLNDPKYKDFFLLNATSSGGDFNEGDSEEGASYGGD